MADTLEIVQGATKIFPRQRLDREGNAYSSALNPSPFQATDVLACRVWAGDDTATLATPSVAWTNVTTASFAITCIGTDTNALSNGVYRGQTTITRGIYCAVIDDFSFRVNIAPGTATAPIAFTTLNDLQKYLPMAEDIQSPTSQVGFREEQANATNWLIDVLVMSYQPQSFTTITDPGFNTLSLFGASSNPSRWLREQLIPLVPGSTVPSDMPMRPNTQPNFVQPRVSTCLLLYDHVIEIVAKKAVSYVLEAQISRSSDQDWWKLARMFEGRANSLFRSRKFEIDLATPQSGWSGITINGGASSLR
jgi:hypothetical protein